MISKPLDKPVVNYAEKKERNQSCGSSTKGEDPQKDTKITVHNKSLLLNLFDDPNPAASVENSSGET